MTLPPAIRDVVDAALSSGLDGYPVRFRLADERGVKHVRKATEAATDAPVPLKSPLGRNAFLCGCLDRLQHQPVEHLIVGFGEERGSSTRIDRLAHLVGSSGSVAFPPWVLDTISTELGTPRGAALVVHNHPAESLDSQLDALPIASVADRQLLIEAHGGWPMFLARSAKGDRRLRFYVVASGFMREFRTPALLRTLMQLNASSAQNGG